jgi:hypothetical protein
MNNPITNNRSWIHRTNKNRTSESDIDDKFRIINMLKIEFGLSALTDEVVQIPEGEGYASYRQPDLLIKTTKPKKSIIELMGLVHGSDSETIKPIKDVRKLDDYRLISDKYKVYLVYADETDCYDLDLVKNSLIFQGLEINEPRKEYYRRRASQNGL